MTICSDCATNKALVPKGKVVGVWMGKCPYCRLESFLCDEVHDYKYPGQKPVTISDVLLYESMNPKRK